MQLLGLIDWVGHLASVGDSLMPDIPSWVPILVGAANGEEPTEDELMDAIFDQADHPIPGWGEAAKETYRRGKKNTKDYVENKTRAADRAVGQGTPPIQGADGTHRFPDGTEAEYNRDTQSWEPKK